jgi:hypothetical protein
MDGRDGLIGCLIAKKGVKGDGVVLSLCYYRADKGIVGQGDVVFFQRCTVLCC